MSVALKSRLETVRTGLGDLKGDGVIFFLGGGGGGNSQLFLQENQMSICFSFVLVREIFPALAGQ